MEYKLVVDGDSAKVVWPNERLTLTTAAPDAPQPAGAIKLSVVGRQIVASGDDVAPKATSSLIVTFGWEVDAEALTKHIQAHVAKVELSGAADQTAVLDGQLSGILSALGYSYGQPEVKKTAAKARHRFNSDLADTPFTVQRGTAQATVYWRKAKEMEIAPGAQLDLVPHINKDGSQAYETKYGDKLRQDHADAIKDGRTTDTVTLRSVNETGLFLYYGGTNSWLELKDAQGRTLDELTRVD
ncbi:hypothetical protein PQ472_00980 [Lacticaseibacillus pabuli]|uniref:Uncharacterized protein n=1 Tax=Lacticaseibacillus pabuli TaxID=3025672 RepID=A0ABY7WRW1_9LACO|nr:hypothetical protein [Lacticaseibacillus sp. KACC 23028]WDF82846.1 hypothetical protein PQ472_00980 [Lacticaseibacillus sp. KACC 23028]